MNPQHPGTIYFFEGGQEVSSRDASSVPDSVKFAEDSQGQLVPVVKVDATTSGDYRFIKEYGPQGQLLRTTRQVKTN